MSTNLKPKVSDIDHLQGNADAILTLVEYGDYQCPYCGHAYPIIKKIQKEFGNNLKFVFRNFPLREIHPLAGAAAVAAEAAAKQDKFWEMHDIIYENQEHLDKTSFDRFANEIGLNISQFKSDSTSSEVIGKIENDFESGIASGVNGTPTFFVNGIRYDDSWEFADLSAHLRELLS